LAGGSRGSESDDARRLDGGSRAKQNDPLERMRLLERTISASVPAFFEVGQALIEINELELYRMLGYTTFAAYTHGRLGTSRGYAYRKMSAARILGILRDAGVDRLPSNEAQTRELAPLIGEPEALRGAWLAALKGSAAGDVTAAGIRAAVTRCRTRRAA
jgi:hypothetical protein